MWGEYHKLRTSPEFKVEWHKFLETAVVKQKPTVAFYQYVTHELFKELVKLEFTVNIVSIIYAVNDADDKPLPPLSHEEKNAIHYIVGFVCRKIHGRLEESSCPGRTEMMLCLSDMNGGDIDNEEHTDEWLRTINRGGLWKVTDEVYQLFLMLEQELKKEISGTEQGKKAKIIEQLMGNENLLFQWCFCTNDLPTEFSIPLLKQIIELFMTVHGHGYASSCLELYKERNKKTLSKKKALRTNLNKDTE